MKRVGKIAIWLAGGLVLSAGARADNVAVASANNPYVPIVTRNIFGLNPNQAGELSGDPPPKITLNGIMSAYGKLQALYKVAGTGKPGPSAKDQSYILSEGQRQDDIEVTHITINDKTNLVTFNNHGVVQEIPLANTPGGSGSGSGSGSGQGGQVSRVNFPRPMGGPGGGTGGNVIGNSSGRGGVGGQNRGTGNNANQNPNMPPMGGAPIMQSIPTRTSYASQQPQQDNVNMTPEERAAMILLSTEKLKSDGNKIWQIMPPLPGGVSGEK